MFEVICITLLFFAILVWIRLRLSEMTVLERNGIPGPKPHLIFGNLFEGTDGRDILEKQKRLIEKFGRIVGYYTGARPNVIVADPELAKLIQVKDFQNFRDRTPFLSYLNPSPKLKSMLIQSGGEKWTQIRSLLSPAFSPSKLKEMTPLMNRSIDSFMKIIENNCETDREINIYDLFHKLGVEIIVRTAFGLSADLQTESENEFLKASKQYLNEKVNKIVLILFTCFPELSPIINWIRSRIQTIKMSYGLTAIGVLWKMSEHIIHLRKEITANKPNDLLQVLLDSHISFDNQINANKLTTTYDKSSNQIGSQQDYISNNSNKMNQMSLTEEEVCANCFNFFVAAYDTTGTGMAFTTHLLINYPEVQERVRQEVKELYEREGELNYNTITGLQYMEWVLNESMRLYPPGSTGSSRECLSDYKYKNIVIPKGATVAIATHYIHHDKDYWTEPEKFDPMRFSPERRHHISLSSWQPFGNGPRNCIGMRFAYLEMKLTLAKLLLKYRLEKGPRTEVGRLETKCKLLTLNPKNGVFAKVMRV